MAFYNYNSSYIRSNVEKTFAILCNKELDKFNGINEIVLNIIQFLKDMDTEKDSLEYYLSTIISRISDHMVSATLLIGKGFIIDGINLVRSSYEDLWLVQNIVYRENYFEEWKEGQEVRPWRLRQLKEIEEIKEENEIIYKSLCNISHCSVASVEHMSIIKNSMEAIVNDYRLVLISYYSFAIQIVEALEEYYGSCEEIKKFNEDALNLNIIMFEDEEK